MRLEYSRFICRKYRLIQIEREKRNHKAVQKRAQIFFSLCILPKISSITYNISPLSYLNISTGQFEVVLSSYSEQDKIAPATLQAAVELVSNGY